MHLDDFFQGLTTVTAEELAEIIKRAEQEQDARLKAKQTTMRENLIKAINDYQKEFPYDGLFIELDADYEGGDEVDILNCDIDINNFR